MTDATEKTATHFIHEIVEEDLRTGKYDGRVVTRFPPEPNGYLHIGHAKAICLDFGTALKYGGTCHLRFDDTNPEAEEEEYVNAIIEDVKWLGFDWGEHLYYASDYFEKMYDYAVELIKKGKAYVCTLSPEEFKEYRGIPTRLGKESPSRNRPVEENLDLFTRMKSGEFKEGEYVVRAKIDMSSPNLHMRDPAIYRIKHARHPHVGDTWHIYPMYDFAHCLEDSIEHVTHSLCTLEFEVHRPLYDWILDELDIYHPQQIEFARLNLTYTVMSKRRLLELVKDGHVNGWDDPRMPTLCGLRRRGYTADAIRHFCDTIGITKYESLTDVALLEHCLRDHLNKVAMRRMAVLNPVRMILENIPEGEVKTCTAVNNPEDEGAGTRELKFGREIYIERDDFMEEPPSKFFRLAPDRSVRLRNAGFVTCTGLEKDPDTGAVTVIRGTWTAPEEKVKVKGTIHWVSSEHAIDAEVRIYDRLFTVENPMDVEEGADWKDTLNPESLKVVTAKVEPTLADAAAGTPLQFERIGYFCADPDSTAVKPIFNRTVTLRDSWAKIAGKPGK
ncbi:MAG: glutamine--tRNA ligase/YqeY domain fusion protein [Verrucomicrobia bacterium]|nr:glutamine--tRNA ligase/YqeY domain fusion protein [Verrucomicrobiota bacterium]